MRVRTSAAALFAAVLVAACHHAPVQSAAPVEHFAVVLEHSSTGWTAHCETGCRWTNVSMPCNGCDIRLDASGISRGYPAREGTTGFEFVVSETKGGWTAKAVRGVTWSSLSMSCAESECRARVDERGVGRV